MPQRKDLQKVLIVGAGPVVIGQGIEFDYAGIQACQMLKEAGYSVVVCNSNPTSAMTDEGTANRIYIEPLTVESLQKIIKAECPQALILHFGGQLAYNLGNSLMESGFLAEHQVEILDIKADSVDRVKNYSTYREKMATNYIKIPSGETIRNLKEGIEHGIAMGFPVAIRSLDAVEGLGTNIAYNQEELDVLIHERLTGSSSHQVLIEESLLGWKEFTWDILKDADGNSLVVGCLEQIDPMGIHSGDSIAVTPPQTLSPEEYRQAVALSENVARMTDLIGNINIQMAQNPKNGEFYIFKVNHSFTRSSAMLAKVTGIPIAALATKLMIGYSLTEIAPRVNLIPPIMSRSEYPILNTLSFQLGTIH